MRLLARREHSARELQLKLRQRGVEGERAVEVVAALAADGWQSDERYVGIRVRGRIEQGYGPLRIAAELAESGVAETLRRDALAAAALEVDWAEQARIAWSRHFRQPPASSAEWQKHYRYLAARGFESSQIRAVLKGSASPDDEG
jgi:regulatory protein